MPRAYHLPLGDPCIRCKLPARSHRVDHIFISDSNGQCIRLECRLPKENHRTVAPRSQVGRHAANPRPYEYRDQTGREQHVEYIGIDGEGQTGPDGNHRYVMLAASNEDGTEEWIAETEDLERGRLKTVECLDLILSLPKNRTKIFSYAFNYDITKMLMDLDNKSLYYFFRPEKRLRPPCEQFKGPYPVKWCSICREECRRKDRLHHDAIYYLNLQGTKFSVGNKNQRRKIWDLIRFFQSKFVGAIKAWKVGNKELWERMSKMKDLRAEFDKLDRKQIRRYCFEETRCMAQLAHKLIDSHTAVDLRLKSYYGAGSSGGAMLEKMGIKGKIFPAPNLMKLAVASAFGGGRFENSVIGAIREELWNYDISSAYPYQLTFLPCLEHGTWTHTTKREDLERAQAQNGALIRYSLGDAPNDEMSWGPFPFREKDGTISYPIESGGGWVWLDEFLAGERIFSHVQFHEAWIYSSNCDCQPFKQIPEFYLHRRRIGKEGPGLVIKLGTNSCYGKLAQSVGNAIFNSWIWAGMITSGTRAQILQMMGLHRDKRNLLMVATDGIYTRERIDAPKPLPTKTDEYIANDDGILTSVPLGGWEEKHCPKGVFVARPGVYFPLNPTKEEIKNVRARGVGRSHVLEYSDAIVAAWEKDGVQAKARVANVSRFCGGKTTISQSRKGFKRASGSKKNNYAPSYGQWVARPVDLTFDPMPKRKGVREDGVTLELRRFPKDETSIPYRSAIRMMNDEAKLMAAAAQEIMEQPDADFMLLDYAQGEVE